MAEASGKRAKVVIATKVGSDMGEGKTVRKDYILRAGGSLACGGCRSTASILQTHFDDEVTPVEETMEAYAQLIAQGKVRAIGASNISPARLDGLAGGQQAARHPALRKPAAALQSLRPRRFESDYAPICEREGLGVITYYSLAAGFLTGKYRREADTGKSAARGGRVKQLSRCARLAILAALDAVAARHDATPAQVSLAWLIARPGVTAPIASATSLEQLDVMQAPALALTADDLAALDAVSA